MKPTLQANILQEYFYQKLLKSDNVWLSYGWWKTGIFFETRCSFDMGLSIRVVGYGSALTSAHIENDRDTINLLYDSISATSTVKNAVQNSYTW